MELHANAKINWTLDITGQRPDGYHLMDMLMQPITLHDTITLEKAPAISLTVSGTPLIPADERHLAYRAAKALQKAAGYEAGAAIHVHKRIPAGAGLGGGSADAAGVLMGLNQLWGLGLGARALEEIGLTLGADVPFCVRGGLARVRGIGEELLSFPEAPAWPLVIIQPCEGLSTGAVFKAYHAQTSIQRPDTDVAEQALRKGDFPTLLPALGNVLESVSIQMRPEIGQALTALKEHGAVAARMSGSGSAVFGLFASPEIAAEAATLLQRRWPRTFLCETCRESVLPQGEKA